MAFPREHLQVRRLVPEGQEIRHSGRPQQLSSLRPKAWITWRRSSPGNDLLYKIFRASESGVMVYPKALLNTKNR
ncbi:MAG: hypothetical protein QM757_45085 [Paludibaculum sp.]